MTATDPMSDDRTTISVGLTAAELARLDHMASRRGTTREALVAQAVDALLAQEAWSGGFIAPPPPMEIPRDDR